MDILLIIIGIFLLLASFVGCVLPVLPGPPLSFLALLSLQLTSWGDFTTRFLWVAAIVAAVVTLLDYVVPVWGARRFGGTRGGVWGAAIGLVVGLFFGPVGIILGPFLGAFLGEFAAHADSNKAFKAAFGSFLGLLTGVVLKLIVSGVFTWYFFKEWLV
ncbi:hypothetical protein BY457_102269 [Marinilabilia salmonicolor]|jgi:hypothetical protein|uniref:DUF456 domain-containing protein n=1 Tax=Marinilabilia salmonicolor TaxID=989 RepID=UPI000D075E39|nr:DUF456 domain-containing protein [Marinilabilia salmonicolor]PRZ01861.1 hypothetical protein BY457_102269 [Marinilabilia salmonicolor]